MKAYKMIIRVLIALTSLISMNHTLMAQDDPLLPTQPKYSTILDTRITGFTITKAETGAKLPFMGSIGLSIKSTEALQTGTKADIIITFLTDGWYLDKNELNTSYFKDIKGSIRTSPGLLGFTGPPVLSTLSSSSKMRTSLENASFSLTRFLDQEPGIVLNPSNQQNDSLKVETVYPFQIPFLDVCIENIRTVEISIPIEIIDSNGFADLLIDKLEFTKFAKQSDNYNDPVVENLRYTIFSGHNNTLTQSPTVDSMSHLKNIKGGSPELYWTLEAKRAGDKDNQFILLELGHNSPVITFSGITSIEMILKTPDGSVLKRELPDIRYSDSDVFNPETAESANIIGRNSEDIHPPLLNATIKALIKETGFEEINLERDFRYNEFLGFLWEAESSEDYYRSPLYMSSKDYPIARGKGQLKIALPVSIRSTDIRSSDITFKLEYLSGNDRAGLKRGTAIIEFEDFLE